MRSMRNPYEALAIALLDAPSPRTTPSQPEETVMSTFTPRPRCPHTKQARVNGWGAVYWDGSAGSREEFPDSIVVKPCVLPAGHTGQCEPNTGDAWWPRDSWVCSAPGTRAEVVASGKLLNVVAR